MTCHDDDSPPAAAPSWQGVFGCAYIIHQWVVIGRQGRRASGHPLLLRIATRVWVYSMALDSAPTVRVPPGSILLNRRVRKPAYRGVSILQPPDGGGGGSPCHTWVVLPQADVFASALYPLSSHPHLYLTLSMSPCSKWRKRRTRTIQRRSSKDQDAPMDPLELADLNSIINTRKSMASAEALAKQETDAARPTPAHASRLVKFAPLPQVEEDMDEDDDASSYDTPSERTLHRYLSVPRRDRLSDAESEMRGRSLVRSWSPFRRHSNDAMSRSPSPTRVTFAEERNRCRELVRATRPGGTGMVTLLDGQRIPARQVGEAPGDSLSPDLWGFAALERRRTSPKTKSEQAEEVQRRYQQEMAALGAEVLSHVRGKATRLRRSQSLPPSTSQRIRVDPTVSIPSPSPRLPRRPDARGIAVVPLPELGLRPRYPREGRSCVSDLLDDDDDDEDEQEEEPKPARRRATTQAAGQEVYMSHKPRKDEWDDEYWPKPSATRHIRTGMHGT